MDSKYQGLATKIRKHALQCENRTYLVAVAGPPGSGKTTIAEKVVNILNTEQSFHNEEHKPKTTFATCISIDGFHYSRGVLDEFLNKEEAYLRRGAPWTFDIDAILKFIKRVRLFANRKYPARIEHSEEIILAPSFDHSIKDPVPNSIPLEPDVRVVVFEGNYLLLNEGRWQEIPSFMDLTIFVDVDLEETRSRIAKRHVASGIEPNLIEAYNRVDKNDYLNGKLVKEKSMCADIVVLSVFDSEYSK
jgi:pantothenate kinase